MTTNDPSKELAEITIPWPSASDTELTDEQQKLFDAKWAEALRVRPRADQPDTWPHEIKYARGLRRVDSWLIQGDPQLDEDASSAFNDDEYALPYPWSVSGGDSMTFPCMQGHKDGRWEISLSTGNVWPYGCHQCVDSDFNNQEAEVAFYGQRVAAQRSIRAGLVTSSVQLRSDARQRPVVDGMIMSHALTWLAGRPAAGKSLLALHLAGCIVNGKAFLGNAIKRPGSVVYVAAERYQSLEPRRLAWEAHNGLTIGLDRPGRGADDWDAPWQPRLIIRPGAIQGKAQWQGLADIARDEGAAAIILDTQSEFVDDMDRADMRVFINGLKAVAATGAAVIVLHHTTEGKDRLAGLDQQTRAADAIMTLNMSGKMRRLVSTKNSLGPHFAPVSFGLVEAAGSVTILGPNPVPTVDLQSHSEVGRTFRTLTPKAQELWIAWWDNFGTGDVDSHQLLSITEASRTTAYRHINSLVTAGVADPVGGDRLSTYRLNQAPDK